MRPRRRRSTSRRCSGGWVTGGSCSASARTPGPRRWCSRWRRCGCSPTDLVLLHHAHRRAGSRRACSTSPAGAAWCSTTSRRSASTAGTPLEPLLLAGRAQLVGDGAATSGSAIGVSEFNSAELRRAGYANVHTVPLFVEPERFGPDRVDRAMQTRLASPAFTLVSVSRVVPHKRFEDLLALHREVLRLRPDARLLVVGGVDRLFPAVRALEAEAARTPGVDAARPGEPRRAGGGLPQRLGLRVDERARGLRRPAPRGDGGGRPGARLRRGRGARDARAGRASASTRSGSRCSPSWRSSSARTRGCARGSWPGSGGDSRRSGPRHSEERLGAALESVGLRRPARAPPAAAGRGWASSCSATVRASPAAPRRSRRRWWRGSSRTGTSAS